MPCSSFASSFRCRLGKALRLRKANYHVEMDVCPFHRWDLSPGEAMDVQEKLRERVVLEDRLGAVRTLAGLDVHADPRQETARAAAALLSFPALEPLEEVTAERPVAPPAHRRTCSCTTDQVERERSASVWR